MSSKYHQNAFSFVKYILMILVDTVLIGFVHLIPIWSKAICKYSVITKYCVLL